MSSTDVVVVDHNPTLDELARLINSAHGEALASARTSVEHALRAGEAVLQAKRLVPEGQWRAWVQSNLPISESTVRLYARLALHRNVIERHSPPSIDAGKKLLSGMGLTMELRGPGPNGAFKRRWGPEVEAEVKRLKDLGWGHQRISEALGGSPSRSAVGYILDPASKHRHMQRTRQKRRDRDAALKRERVERMKAKETARRATAVQARGKDIARAYSLIRQALQSLQIAQDCESTDQDFRAAVASAMLSLYNAEDKIGRAA